MPRIVKGLPYSRNVIEYAFELREAVMWRLVA